MAFASTNQQTNGLGGGLKIVTGDWTGTEGDSDGSLTCAGQVVLGGVIVGGDGTMWNIVPYSFSATSATNLVTITINNRLTVTDGHYFFLVK